MTADVTSFREAASQFATGVTVVSARRGEEVFAMTANAFTTVSLDPPLLLVCVANQARMAAVLAESDRFSVNVLRREQQALSTFFAGAWKEPARPPFRFVPWEGGPRLEGCAAAFGCRRSAILDGGDHRVVLGEVVVIHQGIPPREPLVFHARQYVGLDRTGGAAAPELEAADTPAQLFYDSWG